MMLEKCKALQPELVEMRHQLHQCPELGKNLPLTQSYVAAKLDEYGIEYTLNQGDSGIIAYVNKGKEGKTIALRADMDGLPIKEETGLPFASTNGCMHACGHDSHTAMLLGAAKVINENREMFHGEIRFLFQTSEELSRGAEIMIDNGAMEGVDAVFGTHIGTIISKDIEPGKFIVCPGPIMASFDRFVVTVKGKGCHGSTPEKGIDPMNIAAHIVLGLEAINAREFNACVPVVITIGKIAGGATYNVIPDEVVIEGTTRALNEEVRKKLAESIDTISKGIAQAFGGTAETYMDWGAPAVINNDEMAVLAAECAKNVLGEDMVITSTENPNMGGEDFAYYLAQKPGAFMFLSSANHAKGTDIAHHNSKFNIDEDVLWEGPAVFVSIAEKFLE